MKVAVLGGGPAGLYFAISMKLRDPAHEVDGARAQPRRRHVRLGRRAVRRDARQPRSATTPISAAAIREHFAYWDDIAVDPPGRAHASRAATASAASAACSCCCSCRTRARELGVELRSRPSSTTRRGLSPRLRPRRRRATASTRCVRTEYRRRLPARHRRAPVQVRLARHAPEVRRRLHLHLRGDRARLDVGARLPVRRRHRDLHRRVHARQTWDACGFERHDAGGDDRHLRARSSPSISAATR